MKDNSKYISLNYIKSKTITSKPVHIIYFFLFSEDRANYSDIERKKLK